MLIISIIIGTQNFMEKNISWVAPKLRKFSAILLRCSNFSLYTYSLPLYNTITSSIPETLSLRYLSVLASITVT